jgi:hypothetical protein
MKLLPLSALRTALLMLPLAGATFCGGDDGPTGSSGNTLLDITNESNHSVWYVRVRDCGSQAWGTDLLGSDIIFPGSGQSFALTPGCHDVKLETDPDLHGTLIWTNLTLAQGQVLSQTVTAWTYQAVSAVEKHEKGSQPLPPQLPLRLSASLADY